MMGFQELVGSALTIISCLVTITSASFSKHVDIAHNLLNPGIPYTNSQAPASFLISHAAAVRPSEVSVAIIYEQPSVSPPERERDGEHM